ncbi:MAG TPA: Gar1/Naf1 family protein [Nitrososphaerales archaeon]
MFEAGISLHIAGSGRLIIKSKVDLKPGVILYDAKGQKIAHVIEVFGPVKAPYISAVPLTATAKNTLGKMLYYSRVADLVGKK